ncbi:class I SAM-dependent methyltransferase [bacterium]|nr:class I SAM-dependent methyltransferase [bacterium]HPF35677.1 class I SAM-dependent methyltransferase [Candidatus Krumholzibacteria bacterium]HRX51361.1 class I SAM-dependent methyltransferase [Candidatus Krumholzibacteria bacterium]
MSFYSDFADVYERVFPVRQDTVDFVTDIIGPAPLRVLDLGCGPGRLGARLTELGYAWTGVDVDEAMIARCKADFPHLDARVLDMRRVGDLEDEYDAAVCLGNALSHLDRVDMTGFLGALHHRLKPDAPWIVQTVNWDKLRGQGTFVFPPIELQDGHDFHRRYTGLDGPNCRFQTRLTFEGKELFQGEERMTPLTLADLEARHSAAGFDLDILTADFRDTTYQPGTSLGRVVVFRRDED